jgi:hypothetical protein
MSGVRVADSFLVANGKVRGIELHRERFVGSCAAAGSASSSTKVPIRGPRRG